MKTILVSGAGSGIGRSTAIQLAAEGHNLILLGRNSQNLETTLSLLSKGQHQLLVADITSKESLRNAVLQLGDTVINALVACSGIGGVNQWGDEDRWEEVIETNLTGTYYFINTFLPCLQKSQQKYKHVILLASAMARIGFPGYAALSASKAGLLGLMRSWASIWASENILVNAINPGWVNTGMAEKDIERIAAFAGVSKEEAYGLAVQGVPLKKMTEPEEIAELISFMLNQRSMTGEVVDINCGLFMNS